ncbi:26S proteasome non-ATPase regulatory subunit 1-like [Argiope bruennichi]|uniref:26S proteasome non-ATPase regulatory subunit 1-like n=1 Tax=Argiope bruennichi TaxID=94029 RepID=UPI002494A140|nr:26S proteasome non-ATPase regulatory subunit 1-like [Argiope bruennichi]
MNITSAGGILALLDENQEAVHDFALKKLDSIVDVFWPEISEAIQKIEVLYENEVFSSRKLAALVASKVYYHLGSFEDSVTYALGAGDLFDVNQSSEYVETIIAKCIDLYTKLRIHNAESAEQKTIDPRLEAIVNRMFQRCFQHGQYNQAVGIALETRRLDIFESAIMQSDDVVEMLSYSFKVTMSLIQNRMYRNQVLQTLVNLYKNLETPDYVNMCQCLIFIDDAQAVADVLDKLCTGTEEQSLMAFQIAFDLYESATQQFLSRVLQALKATAPIPANLISILSKPEEKPEGETMETDGEEAKETPPPAPAPKLEDLTEDQKKHQERIEKLATILGGEVSIALNLQFLIRNNHTDMLVLKQTKEAVRNSVCHTATVIANSFMHCGTTSDQFLRDNLEWLARATNWAKFSATASLGVIHKGHENEALHLMSSYLPKDSGSSAGYTEGGGLYALGLIHANHGAAIIDYLLNQLKEATNEVVRHGGCLGLGLAAMGTHRQDVYEQLKFNLYQDDAVTGEAAGVAMGLVMLGSKSATAIEDMVAYAQETQHEKILRGLALGISLTMYGRLEEADTLIESLCRDKDPLLRRSGMHTVAMAYCGTGNNKAIRKLLHVAVSDVNDDVRRAAVEALGFILFRTPEQCPSVVSLLSESYNPHVRYGAALALGISCAGTGNKEAISLLEPMTNDPVNYVRQGALISSALILIQQTEQTCPKVKDFRQLYAKVISDKHDDVMAKFGAILAQGIIDAGGRNVTISLQSRTGHTNMAAVVGMLVFAQFWYWFSLSHFLSLAFTPTAIIGLNADLKMPKMEFRSNAKPSMYAYPPPLEEKKEKEREKVTTAVLSITAKARKKEVEKKEREEKMDVDDDKKDEGTSKDTKDSIKEAAKDSKETQKEKEKKEETDKEGEEKKEDKKEAEPNFEILSNPARVMRQQLKVLQIQEGSRYTPLKEVLIGGIIMMKDNKSDDPEELVEPVAAGGPKVEDEDEPEPPEDFQYLDD